MWQRRAKRAIARLARAGVASQPPESMKKNGGELSLAAVVCLLD
jgi:hypothetical protein